MADYGNKALVMGIFEAAAQDPVLLERLETVPSKVFAEAGMLIAPNTAAAFDKFVHEQTGDLMRLLRMGGPLTALGSFGCGLCKIAAWTVAGLICAVGAAALAGLSVSSPAVLALAAWAGCSAAAALAFIATLATYVTAGIASVCLALCTWIKACP